MPAWAGLGETCTICGTCPHGLAWRAGPVVAARRLAAMGKMPAAGAIKPEEGVRNSAGETIEVQG